MKRCGYVVGLVPEKVAEYEELHVAVWPEVLAQIHRSNIRNYSIFRHKLQLFAYFEYVGEDLVADLAEMAKDEATQRWWKLTDPCQSGGGWQEMAEVFHCE